MNPFDPPRTTITYGYDSASPAFQSTGTLIFGYDVPANWLRAFSFDSVAEKSSSLRQFTGKERDSESGLDYFGARYYGSALGRFISPDPLTATPLHIINPQRWNMYAYALNDPLAFTDPDGRDAIAVNFSKQVPVGGHEGFFSVHKDGSAQYASFGPEGGGKPSAPGAVKWAQADFTVEFQPNGVPTQASYKQLADLAAKVEGQDPTTVNMNYFKTSELDTAAQDAWIQRIAEASARGQAPWYDVTRQNCATFCIAGLVQGNAIQKSRKSRDMTLKHHNAYDARSTTTMTSCAQQ